MKYIIVFLTIFYSHLSFSQLEDPFKQLGTELPTPNSYRTASGAPGADYWQNEADYIIDVKLNESNQSISGTEAITYINNSPDKLKYLWLQLDQNVRAKDSDTYMIRESKFDESSNTRTIDNLDPSFDGGFKLTAVTDVNGNKLDYTINKTMMRIDLPKEISHGEKYTFKIDWNFNINNRMEIGGRSGYEYFEENDNYLFTIAQFFPRMCVYDDIEGWQNKQFLGRGEFTVPFGDYKVSITVPEDHLVSATGTLSNKEEVLSKQQLDRYKKAETEYEQPVIIVTQKEAEKREKKKLKGTKTWVFEADNVRDFAFASSRKFIWDAMAVKVGDKNIMAMSMYPKEGNPLWEKFSTKAVAHTIKWYSHYTIDYPYPVAWSINAARIGMEYPMICFNFGRTEKDGTYSERTKYGMIGVIIHEVGHNFFPMIINSDERQWTWMDEGLNSYVQFITEQEWERDYPSRRGEARKIVPYMAGDQEGMVPIMTNSESIKQFGNNAYGKPATALNILRETVMGRELFDYAFKEYCERWKFKHPSPQDFFRTMEDASAVDLDWFWRGWFYTTMPVDISLSTVTTKVINDHNPQSISKKAKAERDKIRTITSIRNAKEIEKTYDEIDPSLRDFYTTYDRLDVTKEDRDNYQDSQKSLTPAQKELINERANFYELTFENKGGLISPIIFQFQYTDGSTEDVRLPAEVWKMGNLKFTKTFKRNKVVERIVLDPYYETADIDRNNNYFPAQNEPDAFEIFKNKQRSSKENPMQKAQTNKS